MPVEVINGARTSFGVRNVEVQAAAKVPTDEVSKYLLLEVNGNSLPAYRAGDTTNTVFPNGAYVISWTAYAPVLTTATVQLDFVSAATGTTLGLAEPALGVNAAKWVRSTTPLIVPEAAQITATGPAANQVAYVLIEYLAPMVV